MYRTTANHCSTEIIVAIPLCTRKRSEGGTPQLTTYPTNTPRTPENYVQLLLQQLYAVGTAGQVHANEGEGMGPKRAENAVALEYYVCGSACRNIIIFLSEAQKIVLNIRNFSICTGCLLYTSPSPRD